MAFYYLYKVNQWHFHWNILTEGWFHTRGKEDVFGEGTSGRTVANLTAWLEPKWATANSVWGAASWGAPPLGCSLPETTGGEGALPSAAAPGQDSSAFRCSAPSTHPPLQDQFPQMMAQKICSEPEVVQEASRRPSISQFDFQLTPAIRSSSHFPTSPAASTFANDCCFPVTLVLTSLLLWGAPRESHLRFMPSCHSPFLNLGWACDALINRGQEKFWV